MSTLSEILRNAHPVPPIRRVPVVEAKTASRETFLEMLAVHIATADYRNMPLKEKS